LVRNTRPEPTGPESISLVLERLVQNRATNLASKNTACLGEILSRIVQVWLKPSWPPMPDCYRQKTDVLCSLVVLFQSKGSLRWNTSGLDLLKRNDPSRYVRNPGNCLSLRQMLVTCLRKESTRRQSAVLLIMEMVGEGTLITLCDSEHWEN